MQTVHSSRLKAALWLTGAGLALACSPVWSETTFKVSGYGTLAGTIDDSTTYQFRSSMNQSEGAEKGFDFFTDSKLGLQGVANFGNGLSVTGQLLGQRKRDDAAARSNNDFNVGFEWLFAQYSPTSNLDLRLGRVVLPAFMISDSRNVGYSQPWLRAPISVYAGMPLTSLDGAQLNWRIPVGSAIVSIQPSYGRSSFNLSSGSIVLKERTKSVRGANVSMEWGDWLLRGGQVKSKSEIPLSAINAFLPSNVFYDMKDTFTSAGVQFDNGTAVVMAEWTQRKMSNLPAMAGGAPLARQDAYYVAGGWRFGKLLPMLIYGQNKDKLTNDTDREVAASLRYELMNNVALKVQIGRYGAKDSQAFVSAAGTSSPDRDKKVNVLSVGLDFVF